MEKQELKDYEDLILLEAGMTREQMIRHAWILERDTAVSEMETEDDGEVLGTAIDDLAEVIAAQDKKIERLKTALEID